MVEIVLVEKNQLEDLSKLASEIIKDHYDPIIGPEQNDYMIKMFQTSEALEEQLDHGHSIYWVKVDGANAGYISYYRRNDEMYLNKFYLHKSYRGKGISKIMLAKVASAAKDEELKLITLNVNRFNTNSINIYNKLGFKILRKEKNDIGEGFYMDDYVMGLELF